jgi:hypothetical protein
VSASTGLVRKDSIEELIGHRAKALELYEMVASTLAEAQAAHARACVGNSYINPPDIYALKSGDYVKRARENVDRDMWRGFVVNTPLGSLMDLQEKNKFDDALKDPPEVTADSVFATMGRLYGESGLIFRRGLVNAFSSLSREYKSHDGFKVGPRMVLEYIVRVERYAGTSKIWSVTLAHHAEERLRDLDRVFHVLDDEPVPDFQQGLCAKIRTAMYPCNEERAWEVKTPYFYCKWFKNGNAHLHFLRDDLLRKANRLIAEHYGAAVGASPGVAEKRRGFAPPRAPAVDDFFETPPDLAKRMIDLANIAPEHAVLEPSAGEGGIVRHMPDYALECLTCYEAHSSRAYKLRRDFPAAIVSNDDFLQAPGSLIYDRVLMNPPFSNGADVAHVAHALGLTKKGGRLVAIMSPGITFRTDHETARLRARLECLGAEFYPIEAGTFKAAGTMISTVLVVVDMPL